MEKLTNALERIFNWMQKHDPHKVSILQPGLNLSEIEEKVRILPFRLPQEVYELYQWRNGIIPGTPGWSGGFGGHDFSSLDSLIKQYFDFMDYSLKGAIIYKNISSVSIRNPQWFSLLGHDKQDYFVIGEQEQKQISPIYCFDYGDIYDFRPKLKYSSLTSMMLTIAECYETGAYYMVEGYIVEGKDINFFEINYSAAEFIRRKYNPDCEYDTPLEEK